MSEGSEHWFDPATGTYVVNETTVANTQIMAALQDQHPEVAALVRWGQHTTQRSSSLFERDRYVTPDNIYDQFRTSYYAAQTDDVVAGVLETSEALALGWLDIEAEDEDESNIWNQIADDIDLETRMKEMWRELFTVSQVYGVTYWGRKSYRVRGKSDNGTKRKKAYNLRVPIGMSLLDPLKVIPVGNFLFNQERLAYIATREEAVDFNRVLAGDNTADLLVMQIIDQKYEPDENEKIRIGQLGVNPDFLYLLNERYVWRHTDTRATYERFAPVRMKSVFELLDLKQQLRAMDRAYIIGGTNFIVLVKKGTDQLPAKPQEVVALANQVRSASRVPVIVGDHRLEVEIVTPKQDLTMKPERYNTLDARLEARLFGMFMTGNYSSGAKSDDSIKLAKIVARGLESRRNGLIRAVHRNMIKPTLDMNSGLSSEIVRILFHPKRIALDFDPSLATLLQDLRDRGDISRESVLDEVGYDQEDEAKKREREAKKYDKIFTPVNVPFDSPNKQTTPADKKAAGRTQGGNRNGGGTNTDSTTPNSNPTRPRQGDNG